MKRLFSLCLMAIALIACSDSGVIEDSPAQITLEKNTVRVGCTVIGTATVKFHTTRDWVATLDDDCDWLTIAPTSGSAGDAKIVITSQPLPDDLPFQEDSPYYGRSATITITADDVVESIEVIQEDRNLAIVTLDTSEIELDIFNLTKSVNFYTTHDWTASLELHHGHGDWLTIEPMSGSAGEAEIVIKAQPNYNAHTFDSYTATITITARNVVKTIDVTEEHFVVTMNGISDSTYSSTDFSQDGIVHTMQTATVGAGIDIIFMGDGFTDRLIANGTYDKVMRLAQDAFFSLEPYKSFRDYFTCRYINAVSKDERVVDWYKSHDTALGVGFNENSAVLDVNAPTVIKYLQEKANIVDMDNTLVIVVANISERRGTCHMYPLGTGLYGAGFAVAVGALCDFQDTLNHECGHGFAKLADEYISYPDKTLPQSSANSLKRTDHPKGWWKNIDVTDNPSEILWGRFLSDPRYASDDIGIFEGGWLYGLGVYRPSEDSMMRTTYTGYGFNAPSREAIYYRIHKLAFGDEWQYDYEKFVEYDLKNIGASRKEHSANHYINCVERPTHNPPVIHNHTWREAVGK